jgi:hypothetical protein
MTDRLYAMIDEDPSMTVSSKRINVFSPRDILALHASLRDATERLRNQYGFKGSALDAAREIAAKAICNAAAEVSQRDILYLADEGVEAVRLSLISGSDVRYRQFLAAKRVSIKRGNSKIPFKTRVKELIDQF